MDTFQRPIYAGNAIATVQSPDPIKVITVRGTAFKAAAAEGGSAVVEALSAFPDTAASKFVSQELSKSERPELTSARVIISGGRGMQSGENFAMCHARGSSHARLGALPDWRERVRAVRRGYYGVEIDMLSSFIRNKAF